MKSKNNKIMIGHRQPLVKNLLLIEGMARVGKFLLANILHGIDGIEPVQVRPILEFLPIFEKFGLIDKKAAEELSRNEIDMACYDLLVGRNLNQRQSDKSSIFNNPRWREYIKRSGAPEGDAALMKFYLKMPYSLFLVHEVIPFLDFYFHIFPKLKVVSLGRSPVDLVFSWYWRKGNMVRRIDRDPRMFRFVFSDQHDQLLVPWYIIGQPEDYHSLSFIDKTILSIGTQSKIYEAAYKKFSPSDKKKICFIRYEDILTQPRVAIKKIVKFLNRKPLPGMRQILKNEHLPNKSYWPEHEEKIKKIKAIASSEYFKRLMVLEDKYFKNYNGKK